MKIRLATKDDFDIFLLAKEAFFTDYNTSKKKRETGENVFSEKVSQKSRTFYEEEFNDFIKNTLILVIEEEKIIGYFAGKIETTSYERYGYISEIFVMNEFRGKGVSTMLKNKFLEILKENKISLCRVEVSPGNSAEEIYKKWNFKIDKHRLSLNF